MSDDEKPKYPVMFFIIDIGVAIAGLWLVIYLKSLFIDLPPTGY